MALKDLAIKYRQASRLLPQKVKQLVNTELQKSRTFFAFKFPIDTGNARANFRLVAGISEWKILNAAESDLGFNYPEFVVKKGSRRPRGSSPESWDRVLPPMVKTETARLEPALDNGIAKIISEILP